MKMLPQMERYKNIVFNKISPNPFLSKDIEELKEFVQNAIKENSLEDVFIADSMIYERRIYKKLIETGQSLKEFCKEDDKSLLEFKSLFSEIWKITAQEKL